ncbi:hypothetical protein K469DRAFT_349397 [Zopfia rhizophila CBS 207.26]|uniref:Uncharacterized protein n=1 Tax=Zopfia rhizophila CBS 207.26 TaxID=1314779 RepID=A0A6A6DJU6_9PEZI|nr:hypothetical protein K469DRAFT_349397 [Zopfia rhizophila CBS 207.26]
MISACHGIHLILQARETGVRFPVGESLIFFGYFFGLKVCVAIALFVSRSFLSDSFSAARDEVIYVNPSDLLDLVFHDKLFSRMFLHQRHSPGFTNLSFPLSGCIERISRNRYRFLEARY